MAIKHLYAITMRSWMFRLLEAFGYSPASSVYVGQNPLDELKASPTFRKSLEEYASDEPLRMMIVDCAPREVEDIAV